MDWGSAKCTNPAVADIVALFGENSCQILP